MYKILNASNANLGAAVAALEAKMAAAIGRGFTPAGSPVIVQNGSNWTVGQAVWCVAVPVDGATPE
jgi:hypothetical protein